MKRELERKAAAKGRTRNGPVCPECDHPYTYTIDTRITRTNRVRRRRLCNKCGYRYTTYESSAQAQAFEDEMPEILDKVLEELKGAMLRLRKIRNAIEVK